MTLIWVNLYRGTVSLYLLTSTACLCTSDVYSRQHSACGQPTVISWSCHDTVTASVRRTYYSVAGPMVWILVTRFSSGPIGQHYSFRSALKTCLLAVQRDTRSLRLSSSHQLFIPRH